MRLWHVDLIEKLPRQQLLGQHREICALRGNGWNKKHKTVDYVFKHPYHVLFDYHELVMAEMICRGYKVDDLWLNEKYRGKTLGIDETKFTTKTKTYNYPEHDEKYLKECLDNLKTKNIII